MSKLPNIEEYLEKIEKLESDIAKRKEFLSSEEYRKPIEQIARIETKLSKLSGLFVHDFLFFFNLRYKDYETFKLLFYIRPEYEDIYLHVNSILEKLLSNILKNNDKKYHCYDLIFKAKKDLPNIEQIVDEVNIRIKKEPIGHFTKKSIQLINKHDLIRILCLYTVDFNFNDTNIRYLVDEILQVNGIFCKSGLCGI